MVSKIIFLGTGGDSFVIGKQIRSAGGIVLKVNDLQFHIDPGPGALINSIQNRINVRENTAIFISNSNINQCNDVNAIIDAMTYSGIDKRGVLVANATLVNGNEKIRPFLTETHKGYLERIIILNAGQKLAIEDVEVDAVVTNNTSDPNTIGFKFYTPDFVLGYTSITAYSKELIQAYHGCDVLILNTQNPGEEKSENSLNTAEAKKLIIKINPKLAILTGFGIRMIKADPLYEAREIQKTTGIQVLAAKDGMVISPSSYSAKSSQKRLNLFKVKEEIVEDNIKSRKIEIKTNLEQNRNQEERPITVAEIEEDESDEEGIVSESDEHKEEQTHLNLDQDF